LVCVQVSSAVTFAHEYIRNTTFNFAKHRRPEHYKLITERTGVKIEPAN